VLTGPPCAGWHLWSPDDEPGTWVPPALLTAARAWAASCRVDDVPPLALGLWSPDGLAPQGTARLLVGDLAAGVDAAYLRDSWAECPELEGARVLAHGTYLLSEVGHVGALGEGVVESLTSADDDGGPVVVSYRVVIPHDPGHALVCEFDTFAATVAEEFELAVLDLVANLAWP
jgi:hypothetical protein